MKQSPSLLFQILVAYLSLAAVTPLFAHEDKVERDLLMHFATGTHRPENGQWEDLTHKAKAKIIGAPVLTNLGPAQVLAFNGVADYLTIAETPAEAASLLPKREMTVATWVFLDDPASAGGILGLLQDRRGVQKGWHLGYQKGHVHFILSSTGADDGDGKHTRLIGGTAITPGRWHHLAAVYDGKTMRLFLDGQADGESQEQSGDIIYPEKGRYTLGALSNLNEIETLEGSLYEVKTYARALTQTEILETVASNQSLLDYRPPVNAELQFVVKPYLQFGTTTGMRILCETTQPAVMTVEYAERQPLTNKVTATNAAAISEVRLENLKPFTIYFYRVTCVDTAGNIARSDVFSFQTMPEKDMPWAFGVMGDTQRNPEITRRCSEGIFALRPTFTLHCGDVVDDGFAKHQWVNDLFVPCERLFAYVPTFPVIGNHEKNAHWYYDYFSMPEPEYFYTFKVGNAEFFMIDSNKNCRKGSEQYNKLEAAFAASTATWKFAAHHHPCFNSDEDDYGDKWKGKTPEAFETGEDHVKDLVPLYEKYGVDIAFAGHIHSYERTWPILQMTINQKKGVRYITSGGGGGTLEQAGPQRSWFSIHVQRGHHFCFATVHDRTIQFKAYDLEGRLFDTFELTKAADR
ncbi:MAG TPA: LamG-like jellyroll fold domain-containing protein [Candidatus Limnocylindria bacterium]|nr:LamG-like jellyroll fold domain-containing protein [Candidatus Limnocylindria bacterium]